MWKFPSSKVFRVTLAVILGTLFLLGFYVAEYVLNCNVQCTQGGICPPCISSVDALIIGLLFLITGSIPAVIAALIVDSLWKKVGLKK